MQITYDKKRYDMTTDEMIAQGGYVPIWIMQWNLNYAMGSNDTLLDYLNKAYTARAGMPFKDRPMGGKIDDKGVYIYPEDPPMYPYMTWDTREGKVYFYPYSIMGIPTGNTHFASRLD